MIQYSISYSNPLSRIVHIEMKFTASEKLTTLKIAAWRPGRYELQKYSANIKNLQVLSGNGTAVSNQKTDRNSWAFESNENEAYIISYDYFAYQMDAGGCWLDEQQIYLNFICCALYLPKRMNEVCIVRLNLPKHYRIACGLPQEGNVLTAESFYHLVDSPVIASEQLQEVCYEVNGTPFYIWIAGKNTVDETKLLHDFKRFTEVQLDMMQSFPEKDYHFLFQFLPYRHYHGVEHRNSTVITLGPADTIATEGYDDLLGISSHELFHAWNIIKIRPKEMMPYDFSKENYFKTGFVAEGFTTYYGDLFLVRSGVISIEEYFKELNTSFKRHFENFGNSVLSLSDSSFDLWVDGYSNPTPDRKVSIYVKGCLVAMLLDMELRLRTGNAKSLDNLLLLLWQKYGKTQTGYTLENILMHAEELAGSSLHDFFTECLEGTTDLKLRLQNTLKNFGCTLLENPNPHFAERVLGFKTTLKNGRYFVEQLAPGSSGEKLLSKDDELLEINSIPITKESFQLLANPLSTLNLKVVRWGQLREISFSMEVKGNFFPSYTIEQAKEATDEEKNNFHRWINGK